jgi:hypothetical protein
MMQPEKPQTFGLPPPPHVWGRVQALPQLTVPPHPLEIVPQLSAPGQEVKGVQDSTQEPELQVSPEPQRVPLGSFDQEV